MYWALRAGFGEHGHPKSVVLEPTLRFFCGMWHHLVDFGAIFDSIGFRMGVPKSTIFEKSEKERENGGPRNYFKKHYSRKL